jgi:tRNA(adenine34) deaminase
MKRREDNKEEYYLKEALKEAYLAAEEGEVPIGAVVVKGEKIIGRGHNKVEKEKDISAHAEIIALKEAAKNLSDWRLGEDSTLYVTVEPCKMCISAAHLARIGKIIYGASATGKNKPKIIKKKIKKRKMQEDCAIIIKEFFARKR